MVTKIDWNKVKFCKDCVTKVEKYLEKYKRDILKGRGINLNIQELASILCDNCFEILCEATIITVDPRVILGEQRRRKET